MGGIDVVVLYVAVESPKAACGGCTPTYIRT